MQICYAPCQAPVQSFRRWNTLSAMQYATCETVYLPNRRLMRTVRLPGSHQIRLKPSLFYDLFYYLVLVNLVDFIIFFVGSSVSCHDHFTVVWWTGFIFSCLSGCRFFHFHLLVLRYCFMCNQSRYKSCGPTKLVLAVYFARLVISVCLVGSNIWRSYVAECVATALHYLHLVHNHTTEQWIHPSGSFKSFTMRCAGKFPTMHASFSSVSYLFLQLIKICISLSRWFRLFLVCCNRQASLCL